MKEATFIGGPLDGQVVQVRGRFCICRDNTGERCSPNRGSRLDNKKSGGCYLHQCNNMIDHFYVHTDAWENWLLLERLTHAFDRHEAAKARG
jgi:hypothetical protein